MEKVKIVKDKSNFRCPYCGEDCGLVIDHTLINPETQEEWKK